MNENEISNLHELSSKNDLTKPIKYEVDIKQSIIHGIPWLGLVCLFATFTFMSINIVGHIQDKVVQLIGLIATLFMSLKMFSSLGYPEFVDRRVE